MARLLKLAIFVFVIWWLMGRSAALSALVTAPITLTQGLASSIEMQNLAKLAVMQRQLDGRFPTADRFGQLVATNMRSPIKDPAKDMWGTPYRYTLAAVGFELRSAGPDRGFGSADDLMLHWKD